jgi:hypothetical protein
MGVWKLIGANRLEVDGRVDEVVPLIWVQISCPLYEICHGLFIDQTSLHRPIMAQYTSTRLSTGMTVNG